MARRRAVVVGGGIGGLAAATGLRRSGWDVVVHERLDDPGADGSGLSVWPNALRALDALGLGDAVRAHGTVQAAGGIRDRRGHWLMRTDVEELRARHGDGIVVLARADLLALLRGALPPGVLVTGSPTDDAAALADVAADADLVVGADGMGSTVRTRVVAPGAVRRSTGTVAWRLIVEVEPPGEGGESWGVGDYVGVAPLPARDGAPGRVYLWLVTRVANAPADFDGLRARFAGCSGTRRTR